MNIPMAIARNMTILPIVYDCFYDLQQGRKIMRGDRVFPNLKLVTRPLPFLDVGVHGFRGNDLWPWSFMSPTPADIDSPA